MGAGVAGLTLGLAAACHLRHLTPRQNARGEQIWRYRCPIRAVLAAAVLGQRQAGVAFVVGEASDNRMPAASTALALLSFASSP